MNSVTAAILIVMVGSVWASNSTVKSARDKLLAKNRIAAAKTLITAIQAASEPAEKQALIKELGNITAVFLTEEGQKSFEMAESLLYAGASGAEARYEESLAREQSNTQVLSGLVRAHLGKNNCDGAQELLRQIEKVNPHLPENALFELAVDICYSRPAQKDLKAPAEPELKRYWQLLLARQMLSAGKIFEAKAALKDLQDWGNPEVDFIQFKLSSPDSNEAVDFAQRYVDQCKAVSPALRRKFKYEVKLCAAEKEAETFVAKSEASK